MCAFSAEVDGRKIVAQVKENEEAAVTFAPYGSVRSLLLTTIHAHVSSFIQDMYDDAISSGHGAYTGRSERPNVFTAVLGNLPPGKQATIHITYITELGFERSAKGAKVDEAQKLRFALPARLAPKRKKNIQGYSNKRLNFQSCI